MEENLIEGEFKNEFANVDESLEVGNININERVVKKNKIYFGSDESDNVSENELGDVDENSEGENINISEKIGQKNKIISTTGKSDIEFNCDPKIKEIFDKLNSLKMPDKTDEPKFQKETWKEPMLNIVLCIRDACYDFGQGSLKINNVSFKNLLDLFLTKLESFSQAIFESKINANCYYFYNMTCALKNIFAFLDENKNLLKFPIEGKRLSIIKFIIGSEANILENYFIDRAKTVTDLKYVLDAFFMVCSNLESFLNEGDYCFLLKDLLVKLVKFLNDNPNFQNDRIKIIDEFIEKLYSRNDKYGRWLCANFVSAIKDMDCIENNGKISESMLNDILVCYFDVEKYLSNNKYATKKFDYIERRVNNFRRTVENISTDSYKYEVDRCIHNIEIFENNLKILWNGCNRFFHTCRSNYIGDDTDDNRNKYQRIKQDRTTLFNKFRELETIKQDLLKQKMIIEHRDNFVPLTKCRKIFYTAIFIATFLIHAPIFILVKTLRKLLHCILMGLEVVDKVGIYLNDEITVKKNCIDVWAEQCEDGYFDGLEINGQQINERIQWYETKRWLFWRRILFPINFVLLIVIGVFLAIKKFFKSIIKVFITDYRIVKNIWGDDLSTYMFVDKDIFQTKISEVICNAKGNISVLPIGKDKNMKIRNKFVDMSCPSVPYCYFSNSKFRDSLQCAIGWKNIKNVDQWNKYAHEHHIPRIYCGSCCYYSSRIIAPKK